MTDKELKRLSRAQLLELLADVTHENEELRADAARMRAELDALAVTDEKLEALGELSRRILRTVEAFAAPAEEPAAGGAVSRETPTP